MSGRRLRCRRFRRLVVLTVACGVTLGVTPASTLAQTASTPALDSAFARARRLVNDGAGAVGRSVVDSVLANVTPGSPDEATALYWRAMLAESWDAAQQDYLRLMLEFDGSALAGQAMLRLAQGELARGDRTAAEQYLERLVRETPEVPARAEAALWHGRLLLERGDATRACTMLRDGRSRVGRTTREASDLLTRYEVLLISCANLEAQPVDTATAPSPAPAPAPVTSPTPVPREPPAAPPPATTSNIPPTVPPAPTPARNTEWTVQLGAYATRDQATAVMRRLGSSVTEVRIDEVPGGPYAFKVRFGRFATRAAAESAAAEHTRRTGAATFVTEAPAR